MESTENSFQFHEHDRPGDVVDHADQNNTTSANVNMNMKDKRNSTSPSQDSHSSSIVESIRNVNENCDPATFENKWTAEVDQCLNDVFGFTHLRPLQRYAINAILDKKDCLLVMPPGAGKSLCYQLPAMLPSQRSGFTLVVSPLVSLKEDQVMSMTGQFKLPRHSVVCFDSRTSRVLQNYINDSLRSRPQRLAQETNKVRCTQEMNLRLVENIHKVSTHILTTTYIHTFASIFRRPLLFHKLPNYGNQLNIT